MRRTFKWLVYGTATAIFIWVIARAFQPDPVLVDIDQVRYGELSVTIDAEGRTRQRETYSISAPVPGQLRRLRLEVGDMVRTGEVVAWLDPVALDMRERGQALAQVEAATALKNAIEARVGEAEATLDQAERDVRRASDLFDQGVIAKQTVEQAQADVTRLRKERDSLLSEVQAAAAEVERARAALINEAAIPVLSPVSGRVLRVREESERTVDAGATLLELADSSQLELVFDVLSRDAVRIKPGVKTIIENWGGDKNLIGRVRLIEPSAFTKTSALGIEEQRVNVIVDLDEMPSELGDGYRVDGRIVVWESPNVLKAAIAAFFRHEEGWATFVVHNGKVSVADVEVGHRSDREIEIVRGLNEGDLVVVHPSEQVKDGVEVQPRPSENTP